MAVYARVSTEGQTVEPQLHALRAYAAARGLEIAAEYDGQELDHVALVPFAWTSIGIPLKICCPGRTIRRGNALCRRAEDLR